MAYLEDGLRGYSGFEAPSPGTPTTIGRQALGGDTHSFRIAKAGPPPRTLEIPSEEDKIIIGVGSLVTIVLETGVELNVYVAHDASGLEMLSPGIQARLEEEGATMVKPLLANPKHKERNLAQRLEGKKEGQTVLLTNGKEATIKRIVNIET